MKYKGKERGFVEGIPGFRSMRRARVKKRTRGSRAKKGKKGTPIPIGTRPNTVTTWQGIAYDNSLIRRRPATDVTAQLRGRSDQSDSSVAG